MSCIWPHHVSKTGVRVNSYCPREQLSISNSPLHLERPPIFRLSFGQFQERCCLIHFLPPSNLEGHQLKSLVISRLWHEPRRHPHSQNP
eukprot:jgi/Botrbrau1/17202/Bobra.126_1s0006.1